MVNFALEKYSGFGRGGGILPIYVIYGSYPNGMFSLPSTSTASSTLQKAMFAYRISLASPRPLKAAADLGSEWIKYEGALATASFSLSRVKLSFLYSCSKSSGA